MRSYIRLDPRLPDRKREYTDGQFRAFVEVLCHATWQADRGKYRSYGVLRAVLGRLARHIPFLIERGDLIPTPDGGLYVDGWAEWQEGDYTAPERMRRARNRNRSTSGQQGTVTPGGVTPVTSSGTKDIDNRLNDRNAGGSFMGWQPRPTPTPEAELARPPGERERLAAAIRGSVPAMRPRLVATYERHYGAWDDEEVSGSEDRSDPDPNTKGEG